MRLELPPASAGTSSLAEALHAVGQTPLPPYLRREAEEGDVESYQTVYASSDGSVAAPTAGLHMTGDVLAEVRERGVSVEEVVLHVGAGTFAPVSAETVGGHDMHEEQICLERRCVERLLTQVAEDKPIISMVGD